MLHDLSHPSVLRVQELLHDDEYYYVVTELIEGGELLDRIVEVGKFDEEKTAYILKQVLLAINYMHQKSMTHRDLKPENILIESKNNLEIRIADFGFSCIFDNKEGLDLKLGSPHYMAPEVIKRQNYNEKVDIWAIGVLTFVLLTGEIPFIGSSNEEIKKMIL